MIYDVNIFFVYKYFNIVNRLFSVFLLMYVSFLILIEIFEKDF